MAEPKGEELETHKGSLKLTQIQKEVIVGTLLGDSSMEARDKKPVYALKFERKIEQEDYVNHIHSLFSEWSEMKPTARVIIGGGAKDRQTIWFRTYRHISFKFYHDIFYSSLSGKKVKVVPKIIHRLLTARSLAYWFMDDGSFYSYANGDKSYILNTQGFKLHEQKILVIALKRNFDIIANINKDKDSYRLRILAESQLKFFNLVQPFVLPSMFYKLEKECI